MIHSLFQSLNHGFNRRLALGLHRRRRDCAAGLLLALLLPGAASAADYSDARCADAVDFAIRTAERRDDGKSEESLQQSIHDSPFVFQQQYPDLEISDMQTLVQQVFQNHWTRFVAAKSTAQSCGKQLRTLMPPSAAEPAPPAGFPSASAGVRS